MNKQLQNFFDNTKQLHILLCIALLLIIIVRVAPIGSGMIKNGGQLLIVGILIYILFQNFIETHHFVLEQKRLEKDRLKKNKKLGKNSADYISDDTMIDIKNNTIASYVLCGFIFILLAYVIYSLFD
jgi:hypothetical protein